MKVYSVTLSLIILMYIYIPEIKVYISEFINLLKKYIFNILLSIVFFLVKQKKNRISP